MKQLSSDQKNKIVAALEARGATQPCPRCLHKGFIIADGYVVNQMQFDLAIFNMGGPSIPAVVTVCEKCGFIAQHALGVLGLMQSNV